MCWSRSGTSWATIEGEFPDMSDPGSLQNLHDIVVPGPAAWWPPAPGWYVLAAVALSVGEWCLYQRRWMS